MAQEKIHISKPIIVEGKYDKIKLSSFVDGIIICTDGFRIFKDKKKLAMLRRLAEPSGVIILTDSDVAGFKLRNFVAGAVGKDKVTSIYIPQIKGKEHRKETASKEGLLGVEGIDIEILRDLFGKAGVLDSEPLVVQDPIDRADFMRDGLIGGDGSSVARQALLSRLDLPSYMSTKALLDVINRVMTKQQYTEFINTFKGE